MNDEINKEPKLIVNLGEERQNDNTVESTFEAPVNEEPAAPSLQQIIREQTLEEDTPLSKSDFSLRKVIGGDILMAEVVRRQVWLFILITFFLIVYISQRYSYDKYITEIANLETELLDAKNKALSSTSELTESTRQSKILELLKAQNDSTLHIADRPPYIIQVDEDER